MTDNAFAQHLFAQYTHLLAQPQFLALVRHLPAARVHAIWDDHDFLWNDALGAEAQANPIHRGKVRLSTAFLEAFRVALAARCAPGAFPASYDHPVFWDATQPPLSTPSLTLAPDLCLHLADVRSARTRTWLLRESKRTLLGDAQRLRLAAAIQAAPQALHLLASGSTLASWKRHYAGDWAWLNRLAAQQRLLVLSGDIHRNESDAFYTGGFALHEATSSGAAVKDAVVIGQRRRNHGLIDVTAEQLRMRFYADNREETHWGRTLDRHTWLPV